MVFSYPVQGCVGLAGMPFHTQLPHAVPNVSTIYKHQQATWAALCMVLLLGFLYTHAAASQTAELFVQSGHTSEVWSVAWSPDGRSLASGSSNVSIWAVDSDAMQVSFVLLPGNEWLAYHPEKLVYNSSLQGDEYAAIRFDQHLRPVYPLVYYRQKLKRPDLAQAFLLPQPEIAPKRLRLWWDRAENKWWWLGGLLLVATAGLGVTLVLRKRSDPMEVAKRFFSQARFQKRDAKPVSTWNDPDEAWTDVTRGIRQAVEQLRSRLSSPSGERQA